MLQRITVMLMSILIGYSVVYFGDGIHVWISSTEFALSNITTWLASLAIIALVVITIIGLICFHGSISDIKNFEADYSAAIALVCLCLTFGVIASPFTSHGPHPWHWINMWSWILLLAITPNILIIARMIDCREEQCRQKELPEYLS